MPTAADQYNQILSQLQGYESAKSIGPQPGYNTAKMPSRESILKRIDETQMLLSLLREVDALLAQHPDLERLIGTLAKLGQL